MIILLKKPVLPIMVGMYLPFSLCAGIFAGGILRGITDKIMAKRPAEDRTTATNNGIIGASGVVAGAAIMGIIISFIILGTHKSLWQLAGLSPVWQSITSGVYSMTSYSFPIGIIMILVSAWIVWVAVRDFIR
jgi:hypothetical protein